MNFAKKPKNDFPEFIETYFRRCRDRVPRIEANAGKWTLEDLIPGLSDFDTRFLVNDAMTAEDWCHMSMEVGRVHLELAQERKDWARNLEHLPGVNLKWNELFDEQLYFTEFAQWSFHHGDTKHIEAARRHVTGRAWTDTDKLYHWKKIAIYYGPYNRAIDPPVNLGAFENKYSLHSRLMHYMAPPVHSAVCLMERKTSPGKLDAFRKARSLFPNPKTIDLILSLVDRHYEEPKYLTEPGVTELDRELDKYLTGMVNVLLEHSSLPCPRDASVPQLKAAVKAASGDVSFSQLFENIKFSRLMKGRLWFYAHDILWFDSLFLIRNELNRIRQNFYETPMRLFARFAYNKDASPEEALQRMTGDVFDKVQADACRRFAAVSIPGCPDAELKKRALEIAATFDPFLCAMEALLECAKERLLKGAKVS
jgi:hypothetical protein